MRLVVENTSKAPVKLGGLVLKPGPNDLDAGQQKLWTELRAKGTSRELIRTKTPRWPIYVQNLFAAGIIKVTHASGADDRQRRRDAQKSSGKAGESSSKSDPKPPRTSTSAKK